MHRQHRITNFACINKNFYKNFLQKSEVGKGWIKLLAKKVYYSSLKKRAETRNYKRSLKRNLYQMYWGWLDGGTD